jgi:hypothetical protein
MKFKKVSENTHGPIVNVITDRGFCIGQISKWHGLFIAKDRNGHDISFPRKTRRRAGEILIEKFNFDGGNES